MERALAWFYKKLGSRYPVAFALVELQSAWFITAGSLGLYALYFDADPGDFWIVVGIAVGLTGLTIGIAMARIHRRLQPVRRWLDSPRADRGAATEAWAAAVSLPLEVVRRDSFLPVLGVAIPGSIAAVAIFGLSPLSFLPIFAAGLVAIGYAGVLHYFALETGMRPVLMDLNRSVSPKMHRTARAIPLRLKLLGTLPMINIITALLASALSGGDPGGGRNLGIDVLIATAVAFTISFELTVLLSRSIMRPINDLERGIEEVRSGNYEVSVPVTTVDELGELSAAFNQMAAGLAEREKIREAFGTYLDEDVANYILSDSFAPEGFEVDVSVLFCDVRDFTSFASDAKASQVVARLNELFEAVVPIISRHGGHVDKFVGDGLLAVFGAPQAYEDHADRAVASAVEIARHVNHDHPGKLSVGIGVNSGRVVAGSIGGAGRLNFSVIGDAVNVAARVEAATRELGEEVLITDTTRRLLGATVEVASRGPQELRGKTEPVQLWAPIVQTTEQKLPQIHAVDAEVDAKGEVRVDGDRPSKRARSLDTRIR
jgi:class 3 adenylate cyclase